MNASLTWKPRTSGRQKIYAPHIDYDRGTKMKKTLLSGLLGLAVSITACKDPKNENSSKLAHGGGGHDDQHVDPLSDSVDVASLTYYKDIKPILAKSCESCHVDGGLAPFDLTTLSQVKKYSKSIKYALMSRSMPPWSADPGHQTYRDDLTLSDQTIGTINAWIDAGMKEGVASDFRPVQKKAFVSDKVLSIHPGEVFTPDQEFTDQYRCFIVPINEEFAATPWVTGFTTIPGNAKVIHHLVAHTADPDVLWALRQMDDEEPGLGYECAGGALPDRISGADTQEALEAREPGIVNRLMTGTHWLSHWAPGMDEGLDLPPGTGLKLPVGGALILQVHFYIGDAPNENDGDTRIGFKLAKEVEKPAFYYPFTNMEWLLGIFNMSMVIPANSDATFHVEAKLSEIAEFGRQTLGLQNASIKNLESHSANLHMHATGASGLVTLQKNGESREETLLSISNWDLHWQRDYQFVQPKIMAMSDLVNWTRKLSCTYSNPNGFDVYGGPASSNEMCYDFALFAFDLGR